MKGAGFGEHLCVFRSRVPTAWQSDSLVEIISGPRIYRWFFRRVPPFEVRCNKWGFSRAYPYRHLIVFEAHTMENFETHWAFENVW